MSGSSVTNWKLFPNISSSIELQEMRITGDAPRDMLIGPMWSLKKWEVLNSIEMEMRRRGSVQGCKAVKQEFENEKTT